MSAFGDYPVRFYAKGLSGIKPKLPVDFANLEARARAEMPEDVYSYVSSGCGDERTQNFNVFRIRPLGSRASDARRLRDARSLRRTLRSPLRLAAFPFARSACSESPGQDGHGDLATARAAAQTGVPMIASTLSNDPMEAIAKALNSGTGFFQLYTPADKALAESFVSRAEAAGFKAIVITLNSWQLGWRPRDLNAANLPQMRGVALANYSAIPTFYRAWRNRQARTPRLRSSCSRAFSAGRSPGPIFPGCAR